MTSLPGHERGRGLLAAGGVLFPDESGRVLVVRLPYDGEHPVAVPGGGWDPRDLSPRRTAAREIAEELGFTPRVGPLACVDWMPDPGHPPIAAYLYWGQPLTADLLAALRPDPAEVGGWALLTPEQAGHALPPKLSRRVRACLRAPRAAGPLELEDGLPVGHTAAHLVPGPAPEYTRLAGVPAGLLHAPGLPRPGRAPEPPLPKAEYLATRPRIRAKARALFTDPAGRVLLVRLPSRPGDPVSAYWDLPGGSVEADHEAPRAAARREVREELGWDHRPGRLLALDWMPGPADGAGRTEGSRYGLPVLHYVFDGGTVTAERLDTLRLARGELVEWRLCGPGEARELLSGVLWDRVRTALAHRHEPGGPVELVRGLPAD